MPKVGVTCSKYTNDVDALACVVAYTELLNLEGVDATGYIMEEPNSSVTEEIKTWGYKYETKPTDTDISYVIADASYPESFPEFVKTENIIEIYDHHSGFEKYWKEQIGDKSKIELIGACATLIWEEYKKRGFKDKISQTSAKLIYAAIVSNTMNFKAKITSPRDVLAFKEISAIVELPKIWIEKYFMDQEDAVYKDPREAIINDIKIIEFPNIKMKITIGQMELWDAKKFVSDYKPLIKEVLNEFDHNQWFFNSPCISKGRNYIYSENEEIKRILEDLLEIKFKDGIAETKDLMLRKEIVKELQNLQM